MVGLHGRRRMVRNQTHDACRAWTDGGRDRGPFAGADRIFAGEGEAVAGFLNAPQTGTTDGRAWLGYRASIARSRGMVPRCAIAHLSSRPGRRVDRAAPKSAFPHTASR